MDKVNLLCYHGMISAHVEEMMLAAGRLIPSALIIVRTKKKRLVALSCGVNSIE